MSVTQRKLPEVNTEEAQKLIEEYKVCSFERIQELSDHYGFKNKRAFQTAMIQGLNTKRGWIAPPKLEEREPEKLEPENIILPAIKLREYKPKKTRRGDEETALLQAGDGHAGKITKSFDEDVYLQRMDTMFDSIMTLITLHRNMYPINRLVITDLGDNVQGENPYQGSKIGTVRMGERDQIAKLALPAWVKLICSLRQEFAEIEFHGFPGNHGHDKLSPETSRADLSLYDLIDAKIGDKKGITINIHEAFGDIINIMGFRHFCFHGDEIPCQQGVPFFALDRKLKSWFMQLGGFNYAHGGHFHKRHSDEVSSRFEYFMVSTLVSDDDWALKKLGISSNPSQWLFGVHPTMGITWRYGLVVDRNFLMEKLPDVYGKEV